LEWRKLGIVKSQLVRMDITTAAVILAAGEGKRIVSDIPQVTMHHV